MEMPENTQTECPAIGVGLLDDAYLAWFGTESECEQALRAWFKASDAERTGAYLAYQAALDREEAAAADLARLWRLAESSEETLVQDVESVAD
jgi:hypothetical protein